MKRLSMVLLATMPLFVAACNTQVAQAPGAAPKSAASDEDKQWTMQNKNYASTRYSALDSINTDNVKNLKVAWTFSTGVLRGHEGGPLVIGSTMYVHTPFPNIVYALDLAKEGAPMKWKYVPKQDPQGRSGRLLRHREPRPGLRRRQDLPEPARHHDRRARCRNRQGTVEGQAGRLQGRARPITSAPMVIKDKVISGISGGEFGVRGFVTANDVKTGKQIWRMYSTGPEAEVGFPGSVETWKGDEWKRGGGTTWGWYSYDPELNLFYYGTGNPGSWNPDQRPGDNKWSMTIFARDPDTGKAKWAYQKTPHDRVGLRRHQREWCLSTSTSRDRREKSWPTSIATDSRTCSTERPANCSWPMPFVAVNWATGVDLKTGRPIENPEKRTSSTKNTKDICPSAMGGKNQQPVAFSPKTNLFYVPTNNLCMDYEGVQVKYQAGQPYVGAIVVSHPGPGRQPRRVHRLGSDDGQEGVGHQGSSWRTGAARWRRAATSCSTARWKAG